MNTDFGSLQKVIAIFFSLLILVNGYFLAKRAGTWFTPGGIISIFWFGYTFFPLALVYSAPINAMSAIYICAAVFLFTLSSYFIPWRGAFLANQKKEALNLKMEFHTNFLLKSFYISQALVILSLILEIRSNGFSLANIVFNLLETSSAYIELRYADEANHSFLTRVGTVFTYVGVMLGGLVFCAARSTSKKVLILMISLFPAVVIMVVQGAKGTLFLCAMFFYSTLLIYRLYAGKISLTDRRTNKNLLLTVAFLLPAIVSSFLARGLHGHDTDYIIEKLLSYMSSYALAHMYAFSDWFSFYTSEPYLMHYEQAEDYYYGFYTFMSVFKALGSTIEVPMGTYDEYFNYNDFLKTNVYTLFRGLILDFGIIGSLLFMFILGTITTFSFYILLRSTKAYFSISFFAIMFGFYYTCFISVFIWNSTFLTFFMFALILMLNRQILILRSKQRRNKLGITK